MADTTIDSLSIKIVSSATEAASSLERVSAAIKKMNAGKKANQTLDFLTKLGANLALVNMHSGAVTGLEKIASAMNTLSGVKSLAKATNGLASLAPAINALHSANLDGVSEKMNTVAKALEPFAGLKGLTGLSSAMKGLKDLPSVTEKLTPEVLDAFAEKAKKVSEAVTPLSTKMTTVAQGFKAIGYEAKSSGQNVEEFQKSISNINIASLINIVNSVYEFSRNVTQTVNKITKDIVDFDGIIERFNRGFGGMAQGTYSWIQRLNKEMGINVQQFMQYSSIFAQMLEGLGVAQKDASQMAVGYTELAYDIWAAYNDIYEGYSDAVAAVQSAIAGQTRPLRRAGFSVLNTTLEQTAANHGLEISIQSATEAEKSYLRYLALVDQAHAQGIVGTYAKEMNTAEGMLRTLGQQMKTLTQEAGNLLLPLLTVVVPRVQAAVRIISGYIKQLAALFGVTLITPEWDSSVGGFTEALEDAAESADGIESGVGGAASAAKELKKTLLGIDEINQLNGQDKSSGGGGGGGGSAASDIGSGLEWDVSSMWTEAIFKDINNQVGEIEEKMKRIMPIVEAIAGGIAMFGLSKVVDQIGTVLGLSAQLKDIFASIVTIAAEVFLEVRFTNQYLEEGNIMDIFAEFLTAGAAGLVLTKTLHNGKLGFGLAFAIAGTVTSFTLGFQVSEGDVDPQRAFEQGISSMLQNTLGGALLGFKVGGLQGALIGATIGVGVTIVSTLIGYVVGSTLVTEEEIRKSITDHFGTVDLSDQEITVRVNRFLLEATNDAYEFANIRLQASLDVETSSADIREGIAKIQTGLSKLKLGLSYEDLEADVNKWLESVVSYMKSSEQMHTISLMMLGMEDSSLGSWISSSYGEINGLVEYYSNALKEVISSGTLTSIDGAWTMTISEENKASMVQTLMGEIADVIQRASEMQYEAKITGLRMELDMTGISGESFEQYMAGVREGMETYIQQMSESRDSLIAAAISKREETGNWEEYQAELEEIERNWVNSVSTSLIKVLNEGTGTIMEAYASELATSSTVFENMIASAIASGGTLEQFLRDTGGGSINNGMELAVETISAKIKSEIGPEAAAAIKQLMTYLEPEEKELTNIAKQWLGAGKQIPDSIRQGLNDTQQLKALAGDENAIMYMLGVERLKSPEFYTMLTNTKNAFAGIPEYAALGISANLKYAYDAATGIVTVTKDGITTELGPATDTIIQNFAALGIDITGTLDGIQPEANKSSKNISASVGTGISSGHGYITNAVGKIKPLIETNLRDSLKTGAFDKFGKVVPNDIWNGISDPYAMKGITGSIGNIVQSMKYSLGSTGFARTFGQNIPRDIAGGVDLNLSSVTNAAANVVANFKIDTDDSIHAMRRMGGNLVKGIVEGMETESTSTNTSNKLSNVTNNLEGKFAKFNKVSSPSKLYRDEIGVWLTRGIVEGMDQPDALVDPLKSMYGTAKDWWDSNAVDVGNGTFSFESDTGKEHYMNLKDASNESNALLREQNALLRQILEKEVDGGGYGTTGEAMIQAASHLNRKTGRTMIPVGG